MKYSFLHNFLYLQDLYHPKKELLNYTLTSTAQIPKETYTTFLISWVTKLKTLLAHPSV